MEYTCSYQDVEPSSLQLFKPPPNVLRPCCMQHFTVMTQRVYNEPKISTTQVILPHKHRDTFDILYSLFPRCSPPVVLQATVGGGEVLGMRHIDYASGKR